MAIAGNAAATDPACIKSPVHDRMKSLIEKSLATDGDQFRYRRIGMGNQSKPDAPQPVETALSGHEA